MIRTIVLTAVVLFATQTYAEDATKSPGLEPALQQCIEAVNSSQDQDNAPQMSDCISVGSNACQNEPGGSSTQGISGCNRQEQAFWDSMVTFIYGELTRSLKGDALTTLKSSQKAWTPWRDTRCKLVYATTKNGSMSQVYLTYCLMETTALRAIDLMDALTAT